MKLFIEDENRHNLLKKRKRITIKIKYNDKHWTTYSWLKTGTFIMWWVKHVSDSLILSYPGTVLGKCNNTMNYKNMLNSDLTLEIDTK